MAEIRQLSSDAAARIEASSSITSLNAVVLGLLENALDANGKNISITVDYSRAMCCVEDDGNGICTADFAEDGGLCKPYHTSNVSGSKDRLGSNGLFLSSVAALSTLTIVSRHQGSSDSNALILHQSRIASRLLPAPEHLALDLAENGTKVSVHDLFGNMAVRVKQRPVSEEDRSIREREWTCLCHSVTGVMLAYGRPISVAVKGLHETHRLRLDVSKAGNRTHGSRFDGHMNSKLIISILRQAVDLDTKAEWVQTSARTSQITIKALICSKPSASRRVQYISLNRRYMPAGGCCESLYEIVNRIFRNSPFGRYGEKNLTRPKRHGSRSTSVEEAGDSLSGLERWPLFVIKVEYGTSQDRGTVHQANFLATVAEILTAMIMSFVREHYLRPQISQRHEGSQRCEPNRNATASEIPETAPKKQAISIRNKATFQSMPSILEAFSKSDFQIRYPPSTLNELTPLDANDTSFRSRFVSSKKRESDITSGLAQVSPSRHFPQKESGTANVSIHAQDSSCAAEDVIETATNSPISSQTEGVPGEIPLINHIEDEYIDWIDPYTKQKYQLNTRTGWTRPVESQSRPVTSNDANFQVAVKRKQSSQSTRPTRSSHGFIPPKEGSWMHKFLHSWKNPVFESAEQPIQTHHTQAHESCRTALFGNGSSEGTYTGNMLLSSDTKMSVSALRQAKVIRQVDEKFILINLPADSDNDFDIVALVDQHASDERIKVEELMQGLCTPASPTVQAYTSPLNLKSDIDTIILEDPIFFDLSAHEHETFMTSASYFAQWGILYDLQFCEVGRPVIRTRRACRLAVLSLPAAIAQRCRVESETLIKLLRTEAWNYKEGPTTKQLTVATEVKDWTLKIQGCPEGILTLINSRACRSAIMFNDPLTLHQCEQLIAVLAKCRFPFQCAHGRPSMVPLMNLNFLGPENNTQDDVADSEDFQRAWNRWK